jgi:hypothetical protein
MNLLRNISLLISRCDSNMRRNDALLIKQERQQLAIAQKVAVLQQQIQAIGQMRDGLHAQGELTREKLFALQRRQAGLRRKIAELKLQQSQQLKQQEESSKLQEQMLINKRKLLRQSNKYRYLYDRGKQQQRIIQRWAEENEIEETISCRR